MMLRTRMRLLPCRKKSRSRWVAPQKRWHTTTWMARRRFGDSWNGSKAFCGKEPRALWRRATGPCSRPPGYTFDRDGRSDAVIANIQCFHFNPVDLNSTTRAFYRHVLAILDESKLPFLVCGSYALQAYTGNGWRTKDLDIF